MKPTVVLASQRPLATGTLRRVYAHPRDPAMVIKVIRPEVIERRWGRGSSWLKRLRRVRQFIAVQREVEEFLSCHARLGGRPAFVQRIEGFVETDLGLGFVTEALRGRDGDFAPTLGALIRDERCDERVLRAYDDFARAFLASNLVIGDFSAENILLAWDETHGERFVLVDGLGCSTLIPVKAYCPTFNRFSKRRQLARVAAQLPTPPRRDWLKIDSRRPGSAAIKVRPRIS